MAKIVGINGLSTQELNFELQKGAKFVIYRYCVSLVIVTLRRNSDIYFVKASESRISKGVPWILLSVVAGWWGIPWGPIFTIQSIYVNFNGGKDVTAEVLRSLRPAAPPPVQAPPLQDGTRILV